MLFVSGCNIPIQLFTCENYGISYNVKDFVATSVRWSKTILLVCVFAFFVGDLAIHRFDPFHPKSIIQECVQITTTVLERTSLFTLLALLSYWLRYRRQDSLERQDSGGVDIERFFRLLLWFDPLKRALREGRLQRLTYC
jgi:hypothetical protein